MRVTRECKAKNLIAVLLVLLPIVANVIMLSYFRVGLHLKEHTMDEVVTNNTSHQMNIANIARQNDTTLQRHDRMILDSGRLITCSRKTTNTQMTIPEFYAKNSGCYHSFKNDTIFFHVGKGGGGTVSHIMESEHSVHVSISHPAPNPKYIESLQKGPGTTLIINVRDPVDRFISAFNWRRGILCHPNDTRERGGYLSIEQPEKYCKFIPREEQMYRETYDSDPSRLAEALCEGSPTRHRAMEDFANIGPAVWSHNSPLMKWLHFLVDERSMDDITERGIHSFIALPVPLGDDKTKFKGYIEQLSLHLIGTRYGQDTAGDIMQHITRNNDSKDTILQQGHSYEHSSVKISNITKPPTLTPRGECCLVRYLENDYRLIRSMLGETTSAVEEEEVVKPLVDAHPVIQKACLWGDAKMQQSCHDTLEAMLIRRANYMNTAQGFC